MTILLAKGGNIALSTLDMRLNTVLIGLHWQASVADLALEIDASVFLLSAAGTVRDDTDFIFYNQDCDASGAVCRMPAVELNAAEDCAGFTMTLSTLPEDVQRLAICLTLDGADGRRCRFGAVPGIRVRIVHGESRQELACYQNENDFDQETALILAELYRHHDGWKFRAVGQGFTGGLRALATHFGVLIADEDSPSANITTTDHPSMTAALTLTKDGTAPGAGPRRQRRTLQDILAAQAEAIKTRYRIIQPLLRRAMQDSPNESQSRLLLDRILQDVLGYELGEIKTEQKIQGRIADYVLAPGGQEALVIEAKRLGAPLRDKQIFQATSYAAYAGLRWAVLTNVMTWQLYRVSTKDKVEANLVFTLDLSNLDDESVYRLMLISKAGITRCDLLEKVWQKKAALSQESLMAAILNEDVLNKIRMVLMRERGCPLTPLEIQDAIERELLR